MQRIYDSLKKVFEQHRLIFWHDSKKEWEQVYDSFERDDTTKIKVEGNEFGTKVTIHKDPDPQACYLLYFPSERPDDIDNWLLDRGDRA